MSAPMSSDLELIPNQHIRQELCVTRPAYRDGRDPKAVKVYTVNQESRYLLFQGIPALGTTQELIKLCAIHGAVEEYRLLDEFPTVDKFMDVVLVKFKRIQSARHAKKKLDDWSFFGGVLHVTYAPEYESVEETREKLQDRRKAIAARLRILGKEQSSKERSMTLECTSQQNQQETDQRNSNKTFVRERIESRIPSLHNNQNNLNQNNTAIGNTNDIQNYKVWQNQTSNSNQSTSYHDNSILMQSQKNSHNEQRYANYNPGNYSSSEQQLQSHDPLPSTSGYYSNNISEQTLVIPPPPKRDEFLNFSKLKKSDQKFEFARVPTANASFPLNFDARKNPQENLEGNVKNMDHEIISESNIKLTENPFHKHAPVFKSTSHGKQGNLNHPKYHKILENVGMKNETIVVKEFKKTGSTPKFIPRQTMNLLKTKSELPKDITSNDELGKEIRKNAIVLGSTQGPALVPEEYQKPEKTPTEKAVEKSISDIRKRMSVFSSEQDDVRKRPKSQ